MQPVNLFLKCLPFVNMVDEFFKDRDYLKRVNEIWDSGRRADEKRPLVEAEEKNNRLSKRAFSYGVMVQCMTAVTLVALGALPSGMMFLTGATLSVIYYQCSDIILKSRVRPYRSQLNQFMGS